MIVSKEKLEEVHAYVKQLEGLVYCLTKMLNDIHNNSDDHAPTDVQFVWVDDLNEFYSKPGEFAIEFKGSSGGEGTVDITIKK